jgi:hypothetical protein
MNFASERVDTFDNFYNSQQVKKTTFVKHIFPSAAPCSSIRDWHCRKKKKKKKKTSFFFFSKGLITGDAKNNLGGQY